ncbi:MAG: hypothetical protein FIA99_20020 [Ruminiclostridium sp.]|nr:hypothetical protein [Ruminiclostridium sp.]
MFEAIISVLIVLMTVVISYPVSSFGKGGKGRVSFGSFLELDWVLEKTPAQASYLMFMVQSFIVVTAAAFAFRISNHIILTLDILYLVSILMLVLYHNFKIAANFSIQKI